MVYTSRDIVRTVSLVLFRGSVSTTCMHHIVGCDRETADIMHPAEITISVVLIWLISANCGNTAEGTVTPEGQSVR